MLLEDGDIVLFQGDSITDCGRNREDPTDLGQGYALMAASRIEAFYPDRSITFLNRGVSGDITKTLEKRWQADCLDLKPTWLSVYIGVNDCWNRYRERPPVDIESFEHSYRNLLSQAQTQLGCRMILIEPFVLPVLDGQEKWREDLDPKIDIVRKMAREFEAVLIPLDGIMHSASARRAPASWAPDGVHPTRAGHALIAEAWLDVVEA